ncbi:MAG: FHA domain-containing protein [Pseudanabaena sp.]|jgi:pSer/pThr/pTyr-binding forkhead associated (FHA) protein|uniref:FHA domain-containing protein n=1 Tax=Pseudanabaena mucicola TaxID=71190 RepID=UPI0025771110|nr:FHA domain-containing protein [Pseudanabaena mucicola]MCA6572588.1 FHA domain-containing protein [Pseudanabaena sp. M53BS1SP1A06MG]MCA6583774.1 FHA domain-containing protein [Pseudanabaena sp. M34BS1SP1A06MG]MCA6587404.1 FHA domain-containing protein [Pseudanabaena sp. M051S1SP1A06QC]MCA6589166.1 FHA domain-containing protein [Pseudanabaena sp. M109S1SP1A06QC]MCA6594491.1 FHA domain-containing protein [Pseudanabaena sp. M38BS1SP1A06MG]MCA6597437.1 FHA domain-containing protein [Pseudanabae
MSELTLVWVETGFTKHYRIGLTMVRIGRDPARCDLVLSDPTVSGLHVVIYFDPQKQKFCLRNMRESNPPVVDGKRLVQQEIELQQNSEIALGHQVLQITEIVTQSATRSISTPHNNPNQVYGLQCPNPKCAKISSYEKITLVCPWCGTSLAGAASSILPLP